ncbi:DarT ssDNA thymidine ADP-ribosyltransferase family protein [Brachyspira hyodysenteriae]|uniref:DarT ssDNA thymidine ADP-ribosyltransferase family protein n=1 Tax=Brachyspira hyodysenteriae TaxID=159 RepID=UPI000A14EAC9|nr:DarT ssDNA thymidine ADP-ribosyltransferase family protein [Brachyspira hyodysenteriae]
MSAKTGKLIYHLTAINNFESIISKGLRPRNKIKPNIDVADNEILNERNKYNLLDYVPFHFFTKTPFDGAVKKEHVTTDFIYICIRRETAKEKGFCIIPHHPLSSEPENTNLIYEYEKGFDKIKWDIIDGNNRDYNNQDIKNACMAECLYKGIISCRMFSSISVKDVESFKKIDKILLKFGFISDKNKYTYHGEYSFFVDINPSWF